MAQYICNNCGYHSASWYGKCPDCQSWNTFEETTITKGKEKIHPVLFAPLATFESKSVRRLKTAMEEFDRVLGGGFVSGSALLLAGEPGVGKSTLLLKSLHSLKTAYISGEESGEQIKQRAQRTNTPLDQLYFTAENQIEGIMKAVEGLKDIQVVVIDSIQTVYSGEIDAPLGSVTQLKHIASTLIDFAKKRGLVLILIGHITKEGEIAGPKTLEHLVDSVLYFEGERVSNFRILRAQKNRFGPTDEVGIFEMNEEGLSEVKNPALFVDVDTKAVGKATVGIVEGTRPLFFEVQALAVPTVLPTPRRVVKGVDYNKVQLLLAVIRKNLNLRLDSYDIYVNVVGGISIRSTAADLGIAASIVSSLKDLPIAAKTIFTGEIGLLGEIRQGLYQDKIIKEAKRFGFNHVYSSQNIQSIKELLVIFKS